MVLLYQEYDEEITTSGFATDLRAPRAENQSNLEQKVFSLESTIKAKDVALAKLKDELAAMKDNVYTVGWTAYMSTFSTKQYKTQCMIHANIIWWGILRTSYNSILTYLDIFVDYSYQGHGQSSPTS